MKGLGLTSNLGLCASSQLAPVDSEVGVPEEQPYHLRYKTTVTESFVKPKKCTVQRLLTA